MYASRRAPPPVRLNRSAVLRRACALAGRVLDAVKQTPLAGDAGLSFQDSAPAAGPVAPLTRHSIYAAYADADQAPEGRWQEAHADLIEAIEHAALPWEELNSSLWTGGMCYMIHGLAEGSYVEPEALCGELSQLLETQQLYLMQFHTDTCQLEVLTAAGARWTIMDKRTRTEMSRLIDQMFLYFNWKNHPDYLHYGAERHYELVINYSQLQEAGPAEPAERGMWFRFPGQTHTVTTGNPNSWSHFTALKWHFRAHPSEPGNIPAEEFMQLAQAALQKDQVMFLHTCSSPEERSVLVYKSGRGPWKVCYARGRISIDSSRILRPGSHCMKESSPALEHVRYARAGVVKRFSWQPSAIEPPLSGRDESYYARPEQQFMTYNSARLQLTTGQTIEVSAEDAWKATKYLYWLTFNQKLRPTPQDASLVAMLAGLLPGQAARWA